MAGRADELVIAGMKPSSVSNNSNSFLRLHRGVTFILLVDSFIVLLMIANVTFVFSPNAQNTIVGIFAILLLVNFIGYRKRNPMFYWLGGGVIGLAGFIFGFLALLNLLSGGLLMTFLFVWAMFGSGRRALSHLHPGYKNAYMGQDESIPALELEPGEMLAACPHCMAVLAIRPDLLNPRDNCPYCKLPLVSQALASKFEEE
tara:strand:+ start:1808 stop:2413 length:606 start_codon:yes stop_codon:yes gene_type:complete